MYFWCFQTASLTGYFAVSSQDASKLQQNHILVFCISCVGFITVLAWVLVNKGSKTWQENWENHIDMLEDYVTGPLYKIISKPSYSVSKINLWVSIFFALLWLALIIVYVITYLTFLPSRSGKLAWIEILLGTVTIFITIKFVVSGKSSNAFLKEKEFFMRQSRYKE